MRLLENDAGGPPPLWPLGSPLSFHRKLPGYQPSPLRDVPELAARLGVNRVLVKDESERFGLPAFKMLGASWAAFRALVERTGIDPEGWETVDELAARLAPHRPLALATATDGNHGRALARTARLLGLQAAITVPRGTAQARIDAIAAEGARVTVIDGHYDEAVISVARSAGDRTMVVSDTSWEGYRDVPRWVIDGYSTIFVELASQLAGSGITMLPAPLGVGALAAAMIRYASGTQPRPIIIGVEPLEAACVEAALLAGEVVTLHGEFRTCMAGLNCGTASPVAFPVLAAGLDWNVAIGDTWAEEAMRAYAEVGLRVGETGAASLAAALALTATYPELADSLGLGRGATIVLLATEGVTDPVNYQRVVG